jgi:2,4-dienoyl-CoA reductase-like NADH-dependent reductase (Old Yellow Enzyme family)
MSILFEPAALGTVPIRNRFAHSATYEGLAAEGGDGQRRGRALLLRSLSDLTPRPAR